MYLSSLKGDTTIDNLEKSITNVKIEDKLDNNKAELNTHSKPSQLCLSYQLILDSARSLIKSYRTRSWDRHLLAILLANTRCSRKLNQPKVCLSLHSRELESKHPTIYSIPPRNRVTCFWRYINMHYYYYYYY